MNTPLDTDITIIGAGLVGSALALALAPSGLNIAVVDAGEPSKLNLHSANRDYAARVSAINLSSVQFLKILGVWKTVAANRVSPYRKMYVWDANSKAEITFDSENTDFGQLGYIIENDLIIRALLAQISRCGNISVLHSTVIQQITDEAKCKRVETSSNTITSRLLIGADGQFSKVRELAKVPIEVGHFEQKAIVARIQTELVHQQSAFQRFDHSGPIAYLPLSDGSSSIVWSCDTGLAQDLLKLNTEQFSAHVAEAMDHHLGAVSLLSEPIAFDLKQIHALRYVETRIALVGDAAHRTHPLGGLGANIGFMDAAALAEVITAKHHAKRDFGLLRNLRPYERWRRHQNNTALNAMQLFKSAFGSDLPAISTMREVALNLADSNTLLKSVIKQAGMGTKGFVNDLPKSCQVSPYQP